MVPESLTTGPDGRGVAPSPASSPPGLALAAPAGAPRPDTRGDSARSAERPSALEPAFAAADSAALALRAAIERVTLPLARAAAAFAAERAWLPFGYARLDDHARERFSHSGRWLRDLSALGRTLAAFPSLGAALCGSDGGRPLGRVAAILLARAAEGSCSSSCTEGRRIDGAAAGDGRLASAADAAGAAAGAGGASPIAAGASPIAAAGASPGAGTFRVPGDTMARWIALARRASVRDLRGLLASAHLDDGSPAPRREATAEPWCEATAAPMREANTEPWCEATVATAREATAAPQRASSEAGAAPDTDHVVLRLQLPLPVRAAFEEALDLHRAAEGRDVSAASFVEALVGETRSSHPPREGIEIARLVHSLGDAAIEAALRRSTDTWSSLPPPHGPSVAERNASSGSPDGLDRLVAFDAVETLDRFAALDAVAGRGTAADLDAQLRALIAIENELEVRLGALLAGMSERRAWSRLRFAGLGHYAEERLGLSRTRAGERARLARALRRLPLLRNACAAGRVSMEAAAIVHRIVGDGPLPPDLEAAWVERASEATIKRMRDEERAIGREGALGRERAQDQRPAHDWPRLDGQRLAGGGPYSLGRSRTPGPPPMRDPSRVDGSDAAAAWIGSARPGPTGEEARPELSRCSSAEAMGHVDRPRPLDDCAWQASLGREYGTARRRVFSLGFAASGFAPSGFVGAGRVGSGFAASGVVASRAVVSGSSASATSAAEFAAEPDVFQARPLEPDVFLRLRLPAWLAIDFAAAIEEARLRLEEAAAATPWDEAWPAAGMAPSLLLARIEFIRGRRLAAWVGLLAILEEFVLVWDVDAGPRGRDDAAFVRDGWRCTAPGCTSRRNLEQHHVVYRGRGGGDGMDNKTSLCRHHHQRGEHGGLISVRGRAPLGLTWRLGREDLAEWFINDRRIARSHQEAMRTME